VALFLERVRAGGDLLGRGRVREVSGTWAMTTSGDDDDDRDRAGTMPREGVMVRG